METINGASKSLLFQNYSMKTPYYTAFVIAMIGFSSSILAQGWTQLDDFPSTARDDGTSFTINSISYCGTGLNSSWNPTSDFYAFDTNSENWSPITGIPVNEARQYSNGFASSTHGYLFGGLNGNGYLNDLWTYDPLIDTWSAVSPLPSVGRSGASCFVIGDTAYIIGGQIATNQSISEVWAYSMTSDTWTQKNPLPDLLWRASATSFQDKGYVLFGRDNNGIYKNNFYEYSPSNDTWASLSSFPGVGRTYAALSVLNNRIVSIAGRDSIGNSYNDMWEYSTTSDTWTLALNLPAAQRRGGICFNSSTGLYYTTGINLNDVRLTETWKFDLFLEVEELISEEISMYPNPAKILLNIQSSMSTGKFHYHISSILGRTVKSGESDFGQTINIDQLKSGNYLIMITTDSNTYTKKLVIY